jgi:hypothetical protein
MSVKNLHPQYEVASKRWTLTRDAAAGEQAVKAKGASYLPKFIPHDEERYKRYVERAYYMNVTGRTRDALVGMVFRRPESVEVPPAMEFLLEDADGTGVSLIQMAKDCLSNLLETGRHILFVDYSGSAVGLDAESERRAGLRPLILSYHAEALINWRTKIIGGRNRLVMAVLVEAENEARDEFSHDTKQRYRVLRLTDEGYTQQVYDDSGQPQADPTLILMSGGEPFREIPLFTIGANDNKAPVDDTPLYDMAVVNLAHYRNVADLEEAGYIVGQPTLHIDIGETSSEVFKDQNPDGVQMGSRRAVVTQGGSMSLVQPQERGLLLKLKSEKQEEMVKLGARLVQRGAQAETAEAARINAAGEASTLDTLVDNLSSAIEGCLRYCAMFMGTDPGAVTYDLNRNYWESSIDSQTAMAIIQFGDAGIIARSDQRDMIRKGRIELGAERTDEAIDEELGNDVL